MPLGMSQAYGGERSLPRVPLCAGMPQPTPYRLQPWRLSSAYRFKTLSARYPYPRTYPSRELLPREGDSCPPQLPLHPSLSLLTPPRRLVPQPCHRQPSTGSGERLKGIGFAGPGIWEEEVQESAVLAHSIPQTAHVWLIRRIKEGNCRSGCCEVESGGRGAAELRTG